MSQNQDNGHGVLRKESSSNSLAQKLGPASASKVMESIVSLKADMDSIKEKVEKLSKSPGLQASVSTHDIDQDYTRRLSASGYAQQPVQSTKGQAPAGMTPEQQAEFKKQALLVSTLQQKIKDLETKLSDAHTSIRDGEERMREMVEKEEEMGKDIYKTIDTINNSLSEKIAKQRTEVQKLAGDEYKPINYDPFNYGEAYGGDLVDFQARKRIIELKLLLQGLGLSINQIKDSIKVSPSIDLGYKIVRMDQLLAATGFDRTVKENADVESAVVLLSQEKTRKPSVVHYPRKEMFQADEEAESKWSITDSIMQTMYRLEMELGDIQSMMGTSEMSNTGKVLEDIQASLKHMKDTKLDHKAVRMMLNEMQDDSFGGRSGISQSDGREQKDVPYIVHGMETPSFVQQERFDGVVQRLNAHIGSVVSKLKSMEDRLLKPVPGSATAKSHGVGKSCLACDRPVDVNKEKSTDTNTPVLGEFGRTDECYNKKERFPPKLRYLLNRGYEIDVNGQVISVYQIPRPCGSGYTTKWPNIKEDVDQKKTYVPDQVPSVSENFYIKGRDGKLYMGDRHFDKKKWSEEKKKRSKAMSDYSGLKIGEREWQGKVHTTIKYKANETKVTEDRDEFLNRKVRRCPVTHQTLGKKIATERHSRRSLKV